MITIISRKHVKYDSLGRDIIRVYIAVASASELPGKYDIDNAVISEASKAWDISTGDRYGFIDGQGWKKQAAIINPMILKGRVNSVEDLPVNAEPGWVYFVGSGTDVDLPEYMYTEDGVWDRIGSNSIQIDIDSALSTTSENPVQNKVITAALNDKVNAESGKGLSTNDYTNAEKASVALSAEILTPISESAYEALTTKDKPLYFIYDT